MAKAEHHIVYTFVSLHTAVVQNSYNPKWNEIFYVHGYSFQSSHCPRWTA